MMKKNYLLLVALLCTYFNTYAQISGTVYNDFNGNGTRQNATPNIEPGVAGIIINAYDASNTLLTTTTSASDGTYTMPFTVPVRVEFVIPVNSSFCVDSAKDNSSFSGDGNNVRFITATTANLNYGILFPDDYTPDVNPIVYLPVHYAGDPLAGGTSGTQVGFRGMEYNSNGSILSAKTITLASIGSVWGVAYSKQAKKIFTSAFIKRQVGLGPLGTGGIYMLEPTASSFNVTQFYDMDANGYRTRAASSAVAYGQSSSYTVDANGFAIMYNGTIDSESGFPEGLGVVGSNTDRTLPANMNVDSYDPAAFDQVGKVGLGDLDISDDGKFLFVMNLYSRKVYRLELNDAYNPTSVISVTSYAIPSVSVTNGVLRPFAVQYHKEKVYVGAVATGENGGDNIVDGATDLYAHVFEMTNPTGSAIFNSTPILTVPLNYQKGYTITTLNSAVNNKWFPWTNNSNSGVTDGYGETLYPCPVLSNIEFTDRGDMILNFFDRMGHQEGYNNRKNLSTTTAVNLHDVGGDVLIAGKDCATGNFVLENNGSYSSNGIIYTGNTTNNEGPGTGEFFYQEYAPDQYHHETSQGACAMVRGSQAGIFTLMDPVASFQGGVGRFYTNNGTSTNRTVLYSSTDGEMAKANGLGDIELAGVEPPNEVGNRVWFDNNKNGIQDPTELGIANVSIDLFCDFDNDGVADGPSIATTTTDASGNWYFNNANVADGDCPTAGIQIGLQKGKTYLAKIGSADWSGGVGIGDLNTLVLSPANVPIVGIKDASDNDAVLVSSVPQISMTIGDLGQNNHTYDFGVGCSDLPTITTSVYTQATCPAIGITANNTASLQISTGAVKVAISNTGTPTTTFAAASSVTSGSFTFTALNGVADTFYIRLFNTAVCYSDTLIVVQPVRCCPTINTISTPANYASYCSGASIAAFNVTTNAKATDSIRLVSLPNQSSNASYIYANGTILAQKVITGVATTVTNTANFTNISLPTLFGTSNDTLWIYAIYIDKTGDTTCHIVAEKPVIIKPQPTAYINGIPYVCNASTTTLTSDLATTYKWGKMPSATTLATTQTYSPTPTSNATTTYWLVTTNSGTCASDTAFYDVTAGAGISGKVFRDYNSNGVKNTNDVLGFENIKVKLYANDGTILDSTLTDFNGNYSFPIATASMGKLRVEFDKSTFPNYTIESFSGANNGTDVQFVTAPSCAVDLGLKEKEDYCNASPKIVTPVYINGATNGAGITDGLMKWSYSQNGTAVGDKTELASKTDIGSNWGVAYDRINQQIYTATVLKRHVGVKDNDADGFADLGAIYKTDAITGVTTLFMNIPNAGILPNDVARGLGDATSGNVDSAALTYVMKMGLGDIDMSSDQTKLYVTNLNDKKLYEIDIATSAITNSYLIPTPCDTSKGYSRPFGIGMNNGKVFIGVVCDASKSSNENDLETNVYRLDGSTFTNVLSTTLNYAKTSPATSANPTVIGWNGWSDDYATISVIYSGTRRIIHPQPVLSDIVFDNSGNMALGFIDRAGFQGGFGNLAPQTMPTTGTQEFITINGGEILKATKNLSGNFVIESNPVGSGEFYDDGSPVAEHSESSVGALAFNNTINEMVMSAMDPTTNTHANGIVKLNTATGARINSYEVIHIADVQTSGKGTGMGDVEFLCDAAPLQIGNYVWFDNDQDGIQDPNEDPMANMTVSLWKGGTQIASTTTDASGEYYFSTKSVIGAGWTGTGADTTLLPNTAYEVRINMASYPNNYLTLSNSTLATANDQNDNDATLVGGYATIALTTGKAGTINHTYDFGFNCTAPPLTSYVYTPATCPATGITALNTASLQINTTGDKIAMSTTGIPTSTYAAATAVVSNTHTYTAQNGTTDSFYVRIFAGATCFTDTLIVVQPVRCCPTINAVSTPANYTQYCSGTVIPSFNVTTNAIATDSIRLVSFPTQQTNPSVIYNSGTFVAQKVITGTATTVSNTANFTNVPLPTLVGTVNDTLWIYAIYIDKTGDTTCHVIVEKPVIIKPQPVSAISGVNLSCNASAVTLNSLPATSYKWGKMPSATTLATTKTYSPSPTASTTSTYWLVTTNSGTCVSDTVYHSVTASNGILGTAFRDYNSDGIVGTSEIYGFPNIKVRLYDNDGILIDSTITDVDGKYSFPSVTASMGLVKIEFVKSTFPSNIQESFSGASNGTDVQFVTAPNCSINLGLKEKTDYCGVNPKLATPVYVNGDNTNAIAPTQALSFWNYNQVGNTPVPTALASKSQIGSVWGIAYAKTTGVLYSAAFAKRHVGMYENPIGTPRPGMIFKTMNINGTPTNTEFFDVATVPGVDVGTILSNGASGRNLPNTPTSPNNDPTMFDKVGAAALGDLDISEDEQTLWTISLGNGKLLSVPVNNPSTSNVNVFTLPPANCSPGATLRPFGIKVKDSSIYVGAVCDGVGSTLVNGTTPNLTAFVYKFNPPSPLGSGAAVTGTWSIVFEAPLNYTKGSINTGCNSVQNNWKPWTSLWPTQCGSVLVYPQPILSDIEFDLDGSMILGFIDRFGHQASEFNRGLTGTTTYSDLNAGGDLLRASANSDGTYTLESAGISGFNATASGTNNDGPGGGEYYNDSPLNPGHTEVINGGLAILKGSGEIVATCFDPTGATDYATGGVMFFNNTTGVRRNGYQVYNRIDVSYMGKTNGVGDVELLCEEAPIQIGNYVWFDADKDGIQDPNEAPFTNIGVTLWKGGTQIASTTTNAKGEYYFSENSVAGVTWTGTGADTSLLPNTAYEIKINKSAFPILDTLSLTTINSSALYANDQNDNDASMVGNFATISLTTGDAGSIDHSFDFGFSTSPPYATLGNYVWNDLNGNGLNDEPSSAGINGVKVYLCDASNAIIDSTLTANNGGNAGYYLFDSLVTGSYSVKFPTTTGTGKLTTATITVATDNNSDANATTGASPLVVLDDAGSGVAKDNMTIDAGYVFPACLGNYVWNDINKNGTQDASEVGVANVSVTLFNAANEVIGSTKTDAYGFYEFCSLAPGTYKVGVTLPTNYTFTTKDNSTDATDSDVDPITGISGTYTIVSGDSNMTVDAGIYLPLPIKASVGNYVWFDTNADGIQDPTEKGISGVVVELKDNANNVVASSITDANGYYLFNDVTPATGYKVNFTAPIGFIPTTNNSNGLSDEVNSDMLIGTTTTASFNVVAGDSIRYVDAGFIPQPTAKCALGDKVWYDINNDGNQDAGELGVADITVNLKNSVGTTIATTTTNALGNYIFNNLDAGVYSVEFVPSSLPAGYTFTAQNVGTNDVIDGDEDALGLTGVYNLKAGDKNMTVDAGVVNLTNTNSIGDKVWYDANKDGIQDVTEQGVGGITVTLYDNAGTAIATTTTNANGNYLFPSLPNGTYNVGFSNLPEGYTFTTPETTPTATGSDANVSSGMSPTVTLTGGTNIADLDAGIYPNGTPSQTASLGDKVWYDLNNNGIQDAGETGVANILVTLKDAGKDGIVGTADDGVDKITTTNSLGEYIFTNLPAGNYAVEFSNLPSGYSTSPQNAGTNDNADSDGGTPVSGKSITAVYPLALGEDNMSIDLGINKALVNSIGNYVWLDANQNGTQDALEMPVSGVQATLLTSTGDVYDMDNVTAGIQPYVTSTDANGYYLFTNLPDGSYAVQFSNLPAGYQFTTQESSPSGTGSDANTTTGITASVTVMGGQTDLTVDAGIYSSAKATLGNYVWLDANNDGIQDATEKGIAGILVTLYDATNNPVASTITDANGLYIFLNLNPGTYAVGFENLPNGTVFSPQNATGDSVDSDVDPLTGKTATVTLAAGDVNLTVDAGVSPVPTGGLGNYVWFDINKNGAQDASETGVAGTIVSLKNASTGDVIATAITDGNGNYLFPNLTPLVDGYIVNFSSLPFDYLFTQSNGTVANATNSDANSATGNTGTATVVAGQINPNVDAGIFKPVAQLGNYVWNDINKDGIQNTNEVGVAGITVTLFDVMNNVLSSTITDAYGHYLFNPLPAGSYHVGFTLPANYVFSLQNAGTNDSTDSDVLPSTGITANYVLVLGDSNMTVDAGIYFEQPTDASVGNYVWLDVNKDGIQDSGEQGISGVTVTLYNATGQVVATTITDANGFYLFSDVALGNYQVGITAPVGLTSSPNNGTTSNPSNSDINPATGKTVTFTVVAGDKITYVDAGLYSLPTFVGGLGDKVWYDNNQNGIQDAGETGVQGVTVTLYQSDATTIISSTTTDAFGNYIFNNLSAGEYVVGFDNLPSGYVLTTNTGTDSTTNSDANSSTGKTSIINLAQGQFNMTYDAGIYTSVSTNTNSIGDKVWNDANKDGIQDPTEVGVPGITVTLCDNNGSPIAVTSTDANGNYSFPNLPNGTYSVGFSNLPSGYIFSQTGQGTDSTDSKADPSTGKASPVTLTGGTNITNMDAGIKSANTKVGKGTLGDLVWYDFDNNGLQDIGESGVQGVIATLYQQDGTTVIATTTTDALGNYIFTGLDAGSYVVGFTNLPSGFTISTKNADTQGLNGELNSDVNVATQLTDVITLAQGEDKMSVDMGILLPPNTAWLGDKVWIDLVNNGIQDIGVFEPGVPGVTATLYDENGDAIKTTTTDVNGLYFFVGLTPGVLYSVGFSNLPVGYHLVTKDANNTGLIGAFNSDADSLTGLTEQVSLAPGMNYLNIDAGITSDIVAGVGDYVWFDTDKDGFQDPTETGVGGILVTLYNNTNTPVASAITKPDGSYVFTNLISGTYSIGFDNIPPGLEFTQQEVDTTFWGGSNVDVITGKTVPFTLAPGEFNSTIDAGLKTPNNAGLGNYVWIDVDQDGFQDASEPAVAGVLATLYAADETTVLATAVTDGNGAYGFTQLPAGIYVVGFTNIPSGYTRTNSVGTINDAGNSDLLITGKTAAVSLTDGEFNPNVDAGIYYGFPLSAIKLIATTAVIENVKTCKVNWFTVDESNTKDFIIERSIDGIHFTPTGTKEASHQTVGNTNYSFIDDISSVVSARTIYYRIKLRDIDNKTMTSNIISVKQLENTDDLMVYPAPFTDKVMMDYIAPEATSIEAELTDAFGNVVMKVTKDIDKGLNTIVFPDLSHVSSGTYFVKFIDLNQNTKMVRKVVK